MRKVIAFLTFIYSIQNQLSAQNESLQAQLYSPSTLARLQYISDSLHARYKGIPHSKRYWSVSQTQGKWIFLDSMIPEARTFLKTNPSYATFLKKFPFAKTTQTLVVRDSHTTSWAGTQIRIKSCPEYYPYELRVSFKPELYDNSLKGKWLDSLLATNFYRLKSELVACFFENGFEKRILPDKYTQYIQYMDFIADTSTPVFLPNLPTREEYGIVSLPARKSFYRLIFQHRYKPQEGDFDEIIDAGNNNILINPVLEKHLYQTTDFKKQLIAASDEALIKKMPAKGLEKLVLEYLSPAKALQIKRLRRVSSGCGNDDAPRWHFFEMARLAALTGRWQVFMKMYLSLARDPFDRAWEAESRCFFTEQLDSLHVNVPHLYMGGLLIMDNPAKGHFYMHDFWGRANAVGAYSKFNIFEKPLLEAIADTQLDDYNRYELLETYAIILKWRLAITESDAEKKQFHQKWNRAKVLLPNYISSRLVLN